jgi:hypothetical protein
MSGVTLNDLFLAAFSGQPRNHERLGREARRYARKISMRFASDLPEDLHDEIFGEAFAQLWSIPERLTGEQPPLKLFRRAVLLAIRAVRVSYTPPGQRTRTYKAPPAFEVAAEDVGRIPDSDTLEACTVGEGDQRVIDLDRLPSPEAQRAEQAIEDRSEVISILRSSPSTVAAALHRIYLDEEPVQAVARSLAISRFAMNRQISALAKVWRTAA